MFEEDKEQGYAFGPPTSRRQSISTLQVSQPSILTQFANVEPVASKRYLPATLRSLITALCLFGSGLLLGMHYPFFLSVYTRRPDQDLVSLLPKRLPPLPLSLEPPVGGLPNPEPEIPNIVHYVYGLKPPSGAAQDGPEFPYFAYIGMRSAMTVLKPDKVMFHCRYEPTGYWWDQVLNWEGWIDEREGGKRKGLVEVVTAREVEFVGTERRPVKHVSARDDHLR